MLARNVMACILELGAIVVVSRPHSPMWLEYYDSYLLPCNRLLVSATHTRYHPYGARSVAAVMVSQYRLWSSIHCLVSRRVGCNPGTIVLPILRMPALNGVGARPATLRDLRGTASCAFRCFGAGCDPDGSKPVSLLTCPDRAALPACGAVSVRPLVHVVEGGLLP